VNSTNLEAVSEARAAARSSPDGAKSEDYSRRYRGIAERRVPGPLLSRGRSGLNNIQVNEEESKLARSNEALRYPRPGSPYHRALPQEPRRPRTLARRSFEEGHLRSSRMAKVATNPVTPRICAAR